MFALPLLFYVLALVAYATHFARRAPLAGRIATTLLVAGALAHTFVVGMQTMEAGHLPFAGTTQAISTFVWLLGLAYLYTEMTTDERSLGIFILPIIVALQILPAMRGAAVEPRSPVLEHPLFWTHVAALLGVAKLLAVPALLVPGFPRLKEWAYAGMVFNLIGATFSHAMSGDSADRIATPIVVMVLVFTSWALRPASRKLVVAAKSEPHAAEPEPRRALAA